jgi:hypothetical protein
MLCHLGWPIAMNETGRFEKVNRPARRNLETRTRGAAELLFNGVPQILRKRVPIDVLSACAMIPDTGRHGTGTSCRD